MAWGEIIFVVIIKIEKGLFRDFIWWRNPKSHKSSKLINKLILEQ